MKFASLLAGNFTVYTYDRRGRGDSGDTAPYSVEREVEDLQAVITAAGGENVLVYGTLSGAVLALEAAAAGVTGLGKLVLREPRLASGEGDLRPKLSELLMAGRNADAVDLFLSSTAVSDGFRIARGDKFWPVMEASAPAILYDLTISEESSADRYRSVTLPRIPGHPRHTAHSHSSPKTGQTRPRAPARLPEPPPGHPPRRGQDHHQEGSTENYAKRQVKRQAQGVTR